MTSVVYFLERPSNLLWKIGRSSHFRSRYATLCREYGETLRILGILDEDKFLEADLHRLFKDMRVVGEWFIPNRHMRAFVTRHAEPYDPARHDGKANSRHIPLDRELARALSLRAEREGVRVADLLDRLVRESLDSGRPS